MLSRRTKFFALAALLTAALVPGAAVSSSALAAAECLDVDPAQPTAAVEAAKVIVIGTVHEENGGGTVRIEPSAFLLGAASSDAIRPRPPSASAAACAPARLSEGQRILAFLPAADGVLQWPSAGGVFWLEGGQATSGGESPETLPEVELTQKIRSVTGQYAVPAASSDEGAGIDWGHTVIPLGAALAVIFVIGLALMRVWHRIDPS